MAIVTVLLLLGGISFVLSSQKNGSSPPEFAGPEPSEPVVPKVKAPPEEPPPAEPPPAEPPSYSLAAPSDSSESSSTVTEVIEPAVIEPEFTESTEAVPDLFAETATFYTEEEEQSSESATSPNEVAILLEPITTSDLQEQPEAERASLETPVFDESEEEESAAPEETEENGSSEDIEKSERVTQDQEPLKDEPQESEREVLELSLIHI